MYQGTVVLYMPYSPRFPSKNARNTHLRRWKCTPSAVEVHAHARRIYAGRRESTAGRREREPGTAYPRRGAGLACDAGAMPATARWRATARFPGSPRQNMLENQAVCRRGCSVFAQFPAYCKVFSQSAPRYARKPGSLPAGLHVFRAVSVRPHGGPRVRSPGPGRLSRAISPSGSRREP